MFFELHINKIKQVIFPLIFYVCLFSLNITIMRFIMLHGTITFSLLCSIPLSEFTTNLSILQSVDIWVPSTLAFMNIPVHIFGEHMHTILCSIYLGAELLNSCAYILFRYIFSTYNRLFSNLCTNLYFCHMWVRVSVSAHFCQ